MELRDGLALLLLAVGGIDDGGVQHLAGAVDDGHLAAHAVARVQAHGHLALDGRLHQQGAEVQGELADRAFAGRIGQVRAQFALQGGEDQAVIGILGRRLDEGHRARTGHDHGAENRLQGAVAIQNDRDLQHLLLLPAVDGKDLMPLQARDGLGKIVIEAIDRVLLRGRFRDQTAFALQQRPQRFAQGGVVADLLGNDVGGAGEGVFGGLDAFFGIDVIRRLGDGIGAVALLGEQDFGQGLQAFFLRHGRAGAALGLIGAIEILEFGEGADRGDGGREFVRQLALLGNGRKDRLAALLQRAKILQPRLERAQDRVVHGAVELFAVARDKGDRVPLVQQADDVFNIFCFLSQLFRQNLNHRIHPFSSKVFLLL